MQSQCKTGRTLTAVLHYPSLEFMPPPHTQPSLPGEILYTKLHQWCAFLAKIHIKITALYC